MARVMIVFGTRPEAIKMAPVVKEFAKSDRWETTVVVTGQHREMLYQVLDLFDISPDVDLEVMDQGQTLTELTVKVLEGMTQVLKRLQPHWIVVHGDTTTAFAAALAAFYCGIPVAHVEAGLRTGSIRSPFPEEGNRKLTDTMASLFFAPTEQAAVNLRREGVDDSRIFVTGNTVIDALHMVIKSSYQFVLPELQQLSFEKPVVLVTAHRRENWGAPLVEICQALREVVAYHDVDAVFAMHKNPELQSVIQRELAALARVCLVDAPGYQEFANLLKRSTLLLTDSGGLQEEATALGVPVLVLRERTERPEGLESGSLRLVGTRKEDIIEAIANVLGNEEIYRSMANAGNPYGDGHAALRIRRVLEDHICEKVRGDKYGD